MKTEYDFSKGERGRFRLEGAKSGFPRSDKNPTWAPCTDPLGAFIVRETQKSLNAYREQPKLVTEHVRLEQDTAQGGYAHRQLFELVQNSADALLNAPKGKSILLRLTEGFLYCADDGSPIDEDGVEGLMFDRMSSKRNTAAIGRFGRGFKSVIGITDAPEFYSRTGSFRFDKGRTAERIAQVASAERYPVLRLPEPIDPCKEWDQDEELKELMSWATNVVRMPLKKGANDDLAQQIRDFPPEFLLFVDHVRYLTLEDGQGSREFILHRGDGELFLDAGDSSSRWLRFDTTHHLSDEARADWHLHEDNEDVPIQWAAPLDKLSRPGHFWAFFPTTTASLVPGILNAPWKTNEDRQNLLSGPYNEELVKAAAAMIAASLPGLATQTDPARHLDALPRESQAGDSAQVDLLRKRLFIDLHGREIVPDQCGTLRIATDIKYPPRKLTVDRQEDMAPFERWKAYPGRPTDWLHHKALTRNRLARIDRLFDPAGEPPRWPASGAARAEIADWLEALVDDRQSHELAEASMAAVQTAALMSPEARSSERLGNIVLTAAGTLVELEASRIFLPADLLNGDQPSDPETCVHPDLVSDPDTLAALKELGLKPPSQESRFRAVADRILRSDTDQEVNENLYEEFWIASRGLSMDATRAILREHEVRSRWERWAEKLRVRTQAGTWLPLRFVMLPGDIVPGDGSRDDIATVDTRFHEPDDRLLRNLGVTDVPHDGCDLSVEPSFPTFLDRCRNSFTSRDLKRNPHTYLLNFETTVGCGPLHALTRLSDKGRAAYTDALLSLDATFSQWTMRHETQPHVYPDLLCEPLSIDVLRNAGRIQTVAGEIVPFEDALGPTPKSPDALHALLCHPMADKIKAAFRLAEPIPEFFGEGDPIPLTDCWPGLRDYLPAHRKRCRVVPCEQIRVVGHPQECVFHSPDIYVTGTVDGEARRTLQLVVDELGLPLDPARIEEILLRRTPAEIEERRATIRQCSTDAERLVLAVGDQRLRAELPGSLLAVLEKDGAALTETEVAEAAIATYHTDALKRYKWALDHLDPPSSWAGSERAVRFVRSLGFSTEWAGERDRRPGPFLKVEGRYRLPDLHPYQEIVVRNVRQMLRGGSSEKSQRRGMVTMPTGSGKTRVAVQAIVEAMREDDFQGGVLWVADRSELCEQAVEAWRQVWSGIGTHEVHLRISRMWAGQPKPLPTSELHIVVATIQTLNAKLSSTSGDYDFLKDFSLIVFDEAHRSIAPTYTSVMDEIGLTRRQGTDEPFLLGLTATPYRGFNEEETKWLANRYGSNRLDAGAFENDDAQDVVQQLQSIRVLAQADHEIIEGESFSLDNFLDGSPHSEDWQRELDKWRELPWLPQSVEDRIARSAERTKRIIDAYRSHVDPDWPVLIFATSVEHAQTVAALLNRIGIRSRAISGQTETATRRRVVEEFRGGTTKALVNYGVFREGFDAPKTRAIIVARPVYSPNLYFQMIGRGLRGSLNGGNERCLILNVRDNIENFDRSLAFSELDWLWA